jgi:hypothetical protein
MTVLHYKYLRVGTASWSNSYTYIDPIQEIKPNHESTVEFSEGFHIGLSSPIKSVDGLVTVTVTYQIWFLHVNNSETYDFYPVKESDYSVHWRQK